MNANAINTDIYDAILGVSDYLSQKINMFIEMQHTFWG